MAERLLVALAKGGDGLSWWQMADGLLGHASLARCSCRCFWQREEAGNALDCADAHATEKVPVKDVVCPSR